MSHELFLLKSNNTMTNITPIIGDLSWRSNIDELGTELNFSLAHSDARYIPKNPIELGDMVVLKGESGEITRCIVIDEDKQGRQPISYRGFDPAFYLNKSRKTYQFNGISATKAISKMLSDFNIPILNVANIATNINHIYINETISDIIRDILEKAKNETGRKFIMEMKQGKFNLYLATTMVISPKFQLASNLGFSSAVNAISNPARRRSIEEMKNSIEIVNNNKVITQISDPSLISRYGLLSETVDVQDSDVSKARNIAKNTLDELGRVLEENSLEMIGNDLVMSGRYIEIEETITGMKGRYMIKNVIHTVTNGIHKMTLDLGVM